MVLFCIEIRQIGWDSVQVGCWYKFHDSALFPRSAEKLNRILESMVKCPAQGCNYKVPASFNCLTEHCKIVHKWRDNPCLIDGCKFVAYNQKALAYHKSALHSTLNHSYTTKELKCTWKNCKSSFKDRNQLASHMNIHTNNLFKCSFCPYGTANIAVWATHYRQHYGVFDYECELCQRTFVSIGFLRQHEREAHSTEVVCCPLCDTKGKRKSIHSHILHKHDCFAKWNKDLKTFELIKK